MKYFTVAVTFLLALTNGLDAMAFNLGGNGASKGLGKIPGQGLSKVPSKGLGKAPGQGLSKVPGKGLSKPGGKGALSSSPVSPSKGPKVGRPGLKGLAGKAIGKLGGQAGKAISKFGGQAGQTVKNIVGKVSAGGKAAMSKAA